MKIVANGDSFTHEGHFLEIGEEHRWTDKVGAENIAYGGTSNDWIFYSTIEYLNSNNPDILIIGWTNINRYRLTHTNGSNIHVNAGTVSDDYLYGFKKNQNNYSDYGDFYYKKMYNPWLNYTNFINYYQHLEKYCSSRNIKYLNFCSHTDLYHQDLDEIVGSSYLVGNHDDINELRKRRYIDLKQKLMEFKSENWINHSPGFCYERNVAHLPKWKDGYHPGLEASHEWSKIIKANIQS